MPAPGSEGAVQGNHGRHRESGQPAFPVAAMMECRQDTPLIETIDTGALLSEWYTGGAESPVVVEGEDPRRREPGGGMKDRR